MPIELKVPPLGESINEVYIGAWTAEEGQWVDQDTNVVELESDKATFQLPAPVAGVVTQILKPTGETAAIGEVIGYLEETDKPAASPVSSDTPTTTETANQTPPQSPSSDSPAGGHVMPAAVRLLAEHGLHTANIRATGPGGRLLKEDVLRHLESRENQVPSDSTATRSEKTVRMSPIRERIASRLVAAQQNAALLTTFNEIDMSAVIDLRRKYKEAFLEKYQTKLGFMSFFVKATVDALQRIPQLNAEIRDRDIVYRDYVDMGIAIGSGKGLLVPIVRNAELLSFADVELTIRDFAVRAQQNQITLDELQGGTFTITNGGVYGSLLSTPIINPPQSGVLGMHSIEERPVGRDGQIVLRPMMYVALTYDHRIVDGREAVAFLNRIKDTIEDPSRILLEI